MKRVVKAAEYRLVLCRQARYEVFKARVGKTRRALVTLHLQKLRVGQCVVEVHKLFVCHNLPLLCYFFLFSPFLAIFIPFAIENNISM